MNWRFENQSKLLRSIRKELGYSQGLLAQETNVSAQQISNIERSVCGIPVTLASVLIKTHKYPKSRFIDAYKKDIIRRYEMDLSYALEENP